MAIAILASLATTGLTMAGMPLTGAASYGAGFPAGPAVTRDAGAGLAARRPAVGTAAALADGRGKPMHARPLRLAYGGGEDAFLAFLKGLLGIEESREPRRRPDRRPERRAPAPPPAVPSVPPPPPASENGVAAPDDGSAPAPPPPPETFRTMCVRLCDGYYWPVSFATTREQFERDARACTRSCDGSSALYYYRNPGGEPDDMVSLEGQPYKTLGTAFLYRSTYDPSCKCRPHPWEAAAVERHKGYVKPPVGTAARSGRRLPEARASR